MHLAFLEVGRGQMLGTSWRRACVLLGGSWDLVTAHDGLIALLAIGFKPNKASRGDQKVWLEAQT